MKSLNLSHAFKIVCFVFALLGGLNTVSSPVFDAWRARLPDEIRAAFDELPAEIQIKLISTSWKSFANPKLLPALRRLYAEKPKLPPNYDDRSIHSLMLRRIYELAPAEGRDLMLHEIRSANIRFDIRTLDLLPAEPRPDLDDTLMSLWEKGRRANGGVDYTMAITLVQRYGSPALEPRVRAFMTDFVACVPQLLAYFLRVDPPLGIELVNKGLGQRANNGCWRSLITAVGGLIWTPELEQFAMARVSDPDPNIAINAVAALRSHGSPAAEKFLWGEMEKWQKASQKPKEGASPLADGLNMDNLPQLERALAFALAYSPQWVADKPKLQRLQALCTTDEARRTVGTFLKDWQQQPLRIRLNPGQNDNWRSLRPSQGGGYPPTSNDTWSVAQYGCSSLEEFKRKLSQFPPGTAFTFSTDIFTDPEEAKALVNNLRDSLESNGMKLAIAPSK